MSDPFGYWGKGQAYRTPAETPTMAPICPRCSARHRGPTPTCNLPNDTVETDDDDTAD